MFQVNTLDIVELRVHCLVCALTIAQIIHIDSIFCTGSESALIDCPHDSNISDQDHSDDVLLQCQNGIIMYTCT